MTKRGMIVCAFVAVFAALLPGWCVAAMSSSPEEGCCSWHEGIKFCNGEKYVCWEDEWVSGCDCSCDADEDEYYDEYRCWQEPFYGDDCDDENPLINPGMQEVGGNGIDEDCDGLVDEVCFLGAV